jgi:hypothetical protein
LQIKRAVIFWAAVVELQLIGGAASGVVVKTAGQFSEVGLALELILAIVLGDSHIQSIPKADRQKTKQLIFGVESGGVNTAFFSGDQAAQHVIVLIVIAMPTANPAAFNSTSVSVGVPITIKGGTAQAQQNKAKRKNPNARVHLQEVSERNASWQCSRERGITMRARTGPVAPQFTAALATGESLGFDKKFPNCRKAKPKDKNKNNPDHNFIFRVIFQFLLAPLG